MFPIIGISIALFIFLLLVLKKHKKTADKILSIWMAYAAIHLALFYLHYTEQIFDLPFLLGFILPWPILHSVFIFLYAKELTHKNAFKNPNWILHLLPFFILILLLSPFLMSSAEEKIRVFKNGGAGYEWFIIIQLSLFFLTTLIYNFTAYRMLRRYRKKIGNKNQSMLKWLEVLIIGMTLIALVVIFDEDDYWTFVSVCIYIAFIGIYGFKKVPSYFLNMESDITPAIPGNKAKLEKEKYKKSGLSPAQAIMLFEDLEQKMKQEQIYTKNDLTLAEVAIEMQEPSNHLSQAINSQTGVSFYNYINKYRIEAFIELMDNPKYNHLTYLALAMECGFNSKSTFNKHFKKYTGLTPSAFKNLNKQ